MKAITLWQPYATLVAAGYKTTETRSWSTNYHGTIAIHAAKRDDHRTRALFDSVNVLLESAGRPPLLDVLPRGAIVAAVRLICCRRDPVRPDGLDGEFGSFGPGRVAWDLCDARLISPAIPCGGMHRIWTLPPDVEAAVRRAIVETRE